MISGGQHHSNVFNLNLGTYELDKDIKKLTEQVKRLVDKLEKSRASNREHAFQESSLMRESNRIEFDIENLEQQKLSLQSQQQERNKKANDIKKQQEELKRNIERV